MDNDIVKVLFILVILMISSLIFFLVYKENKKKKYVKKCPICKSKNIIHKEPMFVKTIKESIPEYEYRTISRDIIRFREMNTKYFSIERKIFDVEYKCLECQYIFHQELIR